MLRFLKHVRYILTHPMNIVIGYRYIFRDEANLIHFMLYRKK